MRGCLTCRRGSADPSLRDGTLPDPSTPQESGIDVPATATWLTPDLIGITAGTRRLAEMGPEGLPVVSDLLRGQLAKMFGVPDLVGSATPPYHGLLGPTSITGRVIAEPAGIAGGVRGLMVQAAHPRAMAGVTQHSRYREAPLKRLEGTSAWVTTAAFSTVEVAYSQAERVRAMHRRVIGEFEGQPYAAAEPRLLIWISIALTSSFLATHRLYAPDRLAPGEADQFVAEQARAAALLDPRFPLAEHGPHDLPHLPLDEMSLVKDGLPTTEQGLADALADFQPELRVTDDARSAITFLDDIEVPAVIGLVYRRFLDQVAATLPPDLQHELGRADGDRRARMVGLGRTLAGMRAVTGRSPSWHRSQELLQN